MITQIARPIKNVQTAYNPIVWVFDSDNKDEYGFRYICEIYSAGTSNRLGEYYIAPRPNDGYCVLSVDSLLKSYVTWDLNVSEANNSFINYELRIGESYSIQWDYDDYQFYSNTGTTSPGSQFNAYTELTGTTNHNLVIGDQINIVQSDEPDSADPSVSGLHTVVWVPSPTRIVIDLVYQYQNIGFEVPGYVVLADNQRFIERAMLIRSGQTAFNGVVSVVQQQFDDTNYVMTLPNVQTNRLFLTTYPNGKRQRPTDDMYFNFLKSNTNAAGRVYFENDGGDIAYKAWTGQTRIQQVGVGPNNLGSLTLQTGTLPIVKDDTKYYDIYLTNSGGTNQVTTKYRVHIDRRCPIEYPLGPISILFLDRFGSWGSFAFDLRLNDRTNVTRDTYYQHNGSIVNGTWAYDLIKAGDTIYNSQLQRNLTINTNFMTEDEARYFEELITSPITLIKIDGAYRKCIVTDTQYETQYQRNKTLIRYTLNVNLAANQDINI